MDTGDGREGYQKVGAGVRDWRLQPLGWGFFIGFRNRTSETRVAYARAGEDAPTTAAGTAALLLGRGLEYD